MNIPARQNDGVVAQHADDPMVSMIERIISNIDLPIERLNAIMDLRERQMNKQAEQEFNRAFASAMAEMPAVPRTGWNPHLKRQYSTLDDLIKTTRPVLARHSLSLNWEVRSEGAKIWVKAVVRHGGGHQISTEDDGDRDKSGSMNALQGGGSTQTYLKRYTGFAILGMASGDEQDDDGAATGATSANITEAQWRELSDLIAGAGIAEQVVLDAEKISALDFLPAKRFESVKSRLLKTVNSRNGGAK